MKDQQEEVLTPEELEARKLEMLKFYQDSLPYLEAQFKYEDLLFKIDEARFKRTSMQMQYAMMMNPEPDTEGTLTSQKETLEKEIENHSGKKLRKN